MARHTADHDLVNRTAHPRATSHIYAGVYTRAAQVRTRIIAGVHDVHGNSDAINRAIIFCSFYAAIIFDASFATGSNAIYIYEVSNICGACVCDYEMEHYNKPCRCVTICFSLN